MTTIEEIVDRLIHGLEDEYGTIPGGHTLEMNFGTVVGGAIHDLIEARRTEVWRQTELSRLVAVGIPREQAVTIVDDSRYRGSTLDGNAHLQARIASLRGN